MRNLIILFNFNKEYFQLIKILLNTIAFKSEVSLTLRSETFNQQISKTLTLPIDMPPKIAAAMGTLKGATVKIEAPANMHDTEIPVIFNTVFATDQLFLTLV